MRPLAFGHFGSSDVAVQSSWYTANSSNAKIDVDVGVKSLVLRDAICPDLAEPCCEARQRTTALPPAAVITVRMISSEPIVILPYFTSQAGPL